MDPQRPRAVMTVILHHAMSGQDIIQAVKGLAEKEYVEKHYFDNGHDLFSVGCMMAGIARQLAVQPHDAQDQRVDVIDPHRTYTKVSVVSTTPGGHVLGEHVQEHIKEVVTFAEQLKAALVLRPPA